jgi:multiple sugar transport system permease protein
MAWLLFLIVMAITLIQVKLSNRFVYYEGDR